MKQTGGGVSMPSEYFGRDSGRYTPEANVNMGMDSVYGKTHPTSRGMVIGDNMMGPDLGPYPDGLAQTGGRVSMPSEYFGRDSGRYTPEANVNMGMDSAYGKTHPTSRGMVIGDNMMGPDLGPYPDSVAQAGGAYSKIMNPSTGRFVSVTGKLGKTIISNYIKQLNSTR